MSLTLNTQFIFHNVGQGLFYTGKIDMHNGRFNFIYDCGSDRLSGEALSLAISEYKNNLSPNERIGLLIISHLHEDHVSGLNMLLDGNDQECQIETVLLPYFNPIERLIISLASSEVERFPGYFNFLSDPIEFLVSRGVTTINLATKGTLTSEMLEVDIRRFNQVNIIEHQTRLNPVGIWEFRFYYPPANPVVLQLFETCLRNLNINPNDYRRIQEIIIDPDIRRGLRNCYRHIVTSDINRTTLVVVHGPSGNINANGLLHIDPPFSTFPRLDDENAFYNIPNTASTSEISGNGFFQILTGDINLKATRGLPQPLTRLLENHFRPVNSNIILGLIPHHGAESSWSNRIFSTTINPSLWIVSASCPRNTWNHPRYEVIDFIRNNNSYAFWAHQTRRVVIDATIRYSS